MNATDTLPFLIVHGAWVWKAALAGFVLLMLVMTWAIRRELMHHRWRVEMRRFIRRVEPETITGVLRGEGSALARSLSVTATDLTRPSALADWRAGAVHLETSDGRKIALAGELRVLAGSRAATGRGGVPAQLGDAELEEARKATPWLHRWRLLAWADVRTATLLSLRDGDEVTARGQLERGPGSEESDFRSAEVAWTMRGGEGPIELMARRPVVPRPRTSLMLVATFAAVTTFAGYKIEKQLGQSWGEECSAIRWRQINEGRKAPPESSPFLATNSHVCVKATATPANREYALERFNDILEAHRYRDEASLRRLNQMTYFVRGCGAVVERLMDYQRFEEAGLEAARCGDRRAQHLALVAQGRYEEAAALPVPEDSELHEPALPETATLIAAGRWAEAATALDARAAEVRAQPVEDSTANAVGLTATHFQCLAALLRHHGGDPEAEARLRALRAGPHGISCAPMIAELEGPDARNTAAPTWEDPALWESSQLMERLAFAAGVAGDPRRLAMIDSPEEMLAEPSLSRSSALWLLWLTGGELEKAPAAHRVQLLRWRAAHQLLLEDLEGARRSAREAMALAATPGASDCCDFNDLRFLLPVIALYTPATELGADFTEKPGAPEKSWRQIWLHQYGRLMLRSGQSIEGAYFGPDDELPDLLAAAQRGDGRGLARYIAGGRYQTRWWSDTDLIAVLPRITTGRQELVQRLQWSKPVRYLLTPVLDTALGAFSRREVMKLAGLPAQAASWDAILRRVDRVLSDRKRLVALMFFDL